MALDADSVYEDRDARDLHLGRGTAPRPDTLMQTDQTPIAQITLADGAGHTFTCSLLRESPAESR